MNDLGVIADLLTSPRVIALVGYSLDPSRPSNSVARYLRSQGFRVIPVNPQLHGETVDDERAYDRLAGLGNVAAAERAEAAGIRVVWDRCTAIEHRRLRREA